MTFVGRIFINPDLFTFSAEPRLGSVCFVCSVQRDGAGCGGATRLPVQFRPVRRAAARAVGRHPHTAAGGRQSAASHRPARIRHCLDGRDVTAARSLPAAGADGCRLGAKRCVRSGGRLGDRGAPQRVQCGPSGGTQGLTARAGGTSASTTRHRTLPRLGRWLTV